MRPTEAVEIRIAEHLYVVPKPRAKELMEKLEKFRSLAQEQHERMFGDLEKKHGKAGAVIRGFRLREKMSQVELAEKLGISQTDLSKIEHGKRTIGKNLAKKIGKKLGADYRLFL